MTTPILAWTAVNLDNVRTEFLAGLDLRNGPPAAVEAIKATLAARRAEK